MTAAELFRKVRCPLVVALVGAAAFLFGKACTPAPEPQLIETVQVRTQWMTRTVFARETSREQRAEATRTRREVLELPDGTRKTTEDIATASGEVKESVREKLEQMQALAEEAKSWKVETFDPGRLQLGPMVGVSSADLFAGRSLLSSLRVGGSLTYQPPRLPVYGGGFLLFGGGTVVLGASGGITW